jgi:O-acetyl-ADP-ribose deacetylase (regulator of RNase III)/ADP-ribose pyrophosphatase YjhB (NUDIX family)
MRIKDCEIKIVQGDITQLKVDAIVNAANNKLVMGGGVAGAIRKKGGKAIEDEAVKKGPIKIGEAVATGAGALPAKYVIHAATMGMDFATDEDKVRRSCRNSLKVAEELKIGSIAFPALGCGVGGFPLMAGAKIMAQEVLKALRQSPSCLKEVIFCLYDKEAFDIFNKGVFPYLEHIINDLGQGPFCTVDVIIEMPRGIIVVQRSNPPFGWALPGGFVDYGESLEEAAAREAKEETNLELEDLKQFHTYSKPGRDPRFHTVTTVFIAKGKGEPQAASDAASLKVVPADALKSMNLAFDHADIINDYLKGR